MKNMNQIFPPPLRIAALGLMLASAVNGQTFLTSPSTTVDPYLDSHLPGVEITSILTVGDGVTIPDTDGGTTRLVGIPDGIGAIDGSDSRINEPGFFYLLVNHELNSTQGVARDHGEVGAFVSKWKIDKSTLEVVEGDDLSKQFYDWNEGTSGFDLSTATYNRLCSADLPMPTATYNSATGLGSQEFIFLNGEETSGGRALAHVVTGADAGRSYHLEHLGFAAFENVLLTPFEQDKTIAIITDDDENGEVYVYVGDKQTSGTEVEKAGLVGGDLYAIKVAEKPYELDEVIANSIDANETFTLGLIATNGDRPMNGVDTTNRGINAGTLKMGGPEDGAWDTRPGHQNKFYFVTKGTDSNNLNAVTRLWQLEFGDITTPENGGTLTLLLDGPANRLGSLDNMGFEVIGGQPKLYIQEDLGGDSRLSNIWEYDITTGQLEEIASHTGDMFSPGGASFLTSNEESSGIISLKDILGEGVFAVTVQAHTSLGLSDSTELVEHGQLAIIDISGRGTDTLREKVVASGDAWDFRVDGIDPGATWNTTGFTIDADWNKATDGTPLGASPTLIGYGESAGVLATDLVQPAAPRAAASYFRKQFDLADPNNIVLLDLFMKIDDGAVVYVNGIEVARYNMDLAASVGNSTFAAANESSERDWKHIPVNCEDLPLLNTGNVLAVSIHQENDGSSDIRLDAELFAWNASPDGGTTPAIPQNLTVVNPLQKSLELAWDAQADAKFFRIERQQAGDLVWEVVAAEVPGTFTGYVDENLESGVTYNYRMSAYNIHGGSNCGTSGTGTTTVSLLDVLFEEEFKSDLGQFTVVDLSNPDAGWSWSDHNDGNAAGNGYGAGTVPSEDWLITTNPLNFHFFEKEKLFVNIDIDFGGPDVLSLYSTDYDPAVDTDPNTATWVTIDTYVGPGGGSAAESFEYDVSGIPERAYLAFKYASNGPDGGQSVRFNLFDVLVAGECGYDFEGAANSDIEADAATSWEVVNYGSAFGWIYDTYAGQQSAINNNYGSRAGGIDNVETSDDWLISPAFTSFDADALLEFEYYERFGDTLAKPLAVFVTANYTGDPRTTTWTEITPAGLDGSTSGAYIPVSSQPFGITGSDLRVAFHYTSAGNGGGTTKRIGVDKICIGTTPAELTADFTFNQTGTEATFTSSIGGGTEPFTLSWDFGDSSAISTATSPTHVYTNGATYSAVLTVTDADNTVVTVNKDVPVNFTDFIVPAPNGDVRIATFNAAMNSDDINGNAGDANALGTALANGNHPSIRKVAEVIQRVNPDIILLNEFDLVYTGQDLDVPGTLDRVNLLRANYLGVPQASGLTGVQYPYEFIGGTNTGLASGFDLSNDGTVDNTPGDQTYGDDAFGFGQFPGKYGFIVLSKYPIDSANARTFQKFLWKDMPGALLPEDPNDTDGDTNTASYYTADELNVFRLSSKSHWDVPVIVHGQPLHLLCSHPTPPVFDDGETLTHMVKTGTPATFADWNGLRNNDEIRFWADYVDPANDDYIYDDSEIVTGGTDSAGNQLYTGVPSGGLGADKRFVILGDLNADPVDGDSSFEGSNSLLGSSFVDAVPVPESTGAAQQVPASFNNRATKTSSFNLRADFLLPSTYGFQPQQTGVYWPLTGDATFYLLGASDHRSVWADLDLDLEGMPPQQMDYDTWWQSYRHFLPGSAVSGRTDDPDNDDEDNFNEFAFFGDPNAPDGSAPAVETGANGLEYVFRRNRGANLAFGFQKSQTLENPWNTLVEGADYEVVSSSSDPEDFNRQTLRIRLINTPQDQDRVFLRQTAEE